MTGIWNSIKRHIIVDEEPGLEKNGNTVTMPVEALPPTTQAHVSTAETTVPATTAQAATGYVLTEQDLADVADAERLMISSIEDSLTDHSQLMTSFKSLEPFINDVEKRWDAACSTVNISREQLLSITAQLKASSDMNTNVMMERIKETYAVSLSRLENDIVKNQTTRDQIVAERQALQNKMQELDASINAIDTEAGVLRAERDDFAAKIEVKSAAIQTAVSKVFDSFNFPKGK